MLSSDSDLEDSPLGKMLHALTSNSPNCFPLGYHTNCSPDPFICCNISGCTLLATNEEWLLIEGFFHSFHIRCLKGAYPSVQFAEVTSKPLLALWLLLLRRASLMQWTRKEDYEGGQEKEENINVKSVEQDIFDRKVRDLQGEISLLITHYPKEVGFIIYESVFMYNMAVLMWIAKNFRTLLQHFKDQKNCVLLGAMKQARIWWGSRRGCTP